MAFELSLDMSDFERFAAKLGGAIDQVPFALSTLLNEAAFKARRVLVDDLWPRSVTVRSSSFPLCILACGQEHQG
jgi:hypothetical protein